MKLFCINTAIVLALLPPFTFAELPLVTISTDRSLWPNEVTVNTPLDVPIVINGKAAGKMNLPAGRTFPLRAIQGDTVSIEAGGSIITVPATTTDLTIRAETLMQQRNARDAAIPAATPEIPPASANPTPTPQRVVPRNSLAEKISKKLVAVDGRRVHRFDGSSILTKKYLAIYFSASWCGPCRRFTPDLVDWYQRNKGTSDLFDVVFVSSDSSETEMHDYMLEDKMPWPALDYEAAKNRDILKEFRGTGIPCLVIVDNKGAVLSHSYVDGTYVGPRKVLRDLENLLSKGS